MRIVFSWSELLCLVLFASFPGVGTGIQEHPGGFGGLMMESLIQLFWISLKTTYLWLTDQTSDVYDLIDWAFDCILDEEISGIQGLKLEELRRQRSNTISNILVIILMSAVSLKMFRSSIKKSFYDSDLSWQVGADSDVARELKLRKGKLQKADFLRVGRKNFKGNLNTSSHNNGARRSGVKTKHR